MTETLSTITAEECFAKAAEMLDKGHGSVEVAREWRQLGESIAACTKR